MNGVKTVDKKEYGLATRLMAAAVTAVTWPLAWLPLPVGLRFGAACGWLAFRLWGAFMNLGRCGWEAIRFSHRGLGPFLPHVSIAAGGEYLRQALDEAKAAGRGLVIVTGHIGNWEVMCQYVAETFHFHLAIVGRSLDSPLADCLATRMRTSLGHDFIFKTGGAREMVKVVRRPGGVLGTLIDQAAVVNHEGLAVPFMGRPAMTNVGPVRLALHSGAKMIMVLFHREGANHFGTVLPAMDMASFPSEEAALARLNDELGRFIGRYPDQWLWGHKRWKKPTH